MSTIDVVVGLTIPVIRTVRSKKRTTRSGLSQYGIFKRGRNSPTTTDMMPGIMQTIPAIVVRRTAVDISWISSIGASSKPGEGPIHSNQTCFHCHDPQRSRCPVRGLSQSDALPVHTGRGLRTLVIFSCLATAGDRHASSHHLCELLNDIR